MGADVVMGADVGAQVNPSQFPSAIPTGTAGRTKYTQRKRSHMFYFPLAKRSIYIFKLVSYSFYMDTYLLLEEAFSAEDSVLG